MQTKLNLQHAKATMTSQNSQQLLEYWQYKTKLCKIFIVKQSIRRFCIAHCRNYL